MPFLDGIVIFFKCRPEKFIRIQSRKKLISNARMDFKTFFSDFFVTVPLYEVSNIAE